LDKRLVEFPVDLDPLAFDLLWDFLKLFVVLEIHFVNFEVGLSVYVLEILVYQFKGLIHLIEEVSIAICRELVYQSNELIVLVLCRRDKLIVDDVLHVGDCFNRESILRSLRVDLFEVDAIRTFYFWLHLDNLCFAL